MPSLRVVSSLLLLLGTRASGRDFVASNWSLYARIIIVIELRHPKILRLDESRLGQLVIDTHEITAGIAQVHSRFGSEAHVMTRTRHLSPHYAVGQSRAKNSVAMLRLVSNEMRTSWYRQAMTTRTRTRGRNSFAEIICCSHNTRLDVLHPRSGPHRSSQRPRNGRPH